MQLTLFVYLAMSAATSAEAVGIYTSVSAGEDVATGLLDTKVTADVDVLSGVSFCCTALIKKKTRPIGQLFHKKVTM